jgi:hypothetical protein
MFSKGQWLQSGFFLSCFTKTEAAIKKGLIRIANHSVTRGCKSPAQWQKGGTKGKTGTSVNQIEKASPADAIQSEMIFGIYGEPYHPGLAHNVVSRNKSPESAIF